MMMYQSYMGCDTCNKEITRGETYLQLRTIIKGSSRTQGKVKHICLNCNLSNKKSKEEEKKNE